MHRRVIIILIVGAFAMILVERFGPGGVQRRGMRAAAAFQDQLATKLKDDPRFSALGTTVRFDQSLTIFGKVPDDKSLRDLHDIAQTPTGAEFEIKFNVEIEGAATVP